MPSDRSTMRQAARRSIVRAVWHGRPDDALQQAAVRDLAWRGAATNEVEGALARANPGLFDGRLQEIENRSEQFRHNLAAASQDLLDAGIDAVLIKCDPDRDNTYSNFDLVVGDDQWDPARAALTGWAARTSRHALEPDKLLMYPPDGPAAHLHQRVGWFGIPVIEAATLRANARRDGAHPWLVPDDADQLRILVAHTMFQNLVFPLGELVRMRPLLDSAATIDDAANRAADEGWARSFTRAIHQISSVIGRLDADTDAGPLPSPVTLRLSLRVAAEHARALWPHSPALAARELGLRPALVVAKARHRRSAA